MLQYKQELKKKCKCEKTDFQNEMNIGHISKDEPNSSG